MYIQSWRTACTHGTLFKFKYLYLISASLYCEKVLMICNELQIHRSRNSILPLFASIILERGINSETVYLCLHYLSIFVFVRGSVEWRRVVSVVLRSKRARTPRTSRKAAWSTVKREKEKVNIYWQGKKKGHRYTVIITRCSSCMNVRSPLKNALF